MPSAASPCTVAIVLDREAGDCIAALADRMHVWACDTPSNRRAAETCWSKHPGAATENGVTTFRVRDGDSPATMLLGVLHDVNLHHGEYSHDPPWTRLEIVGGTPTPEVRDALAAFGVDVFEQTRFGFRCARPAREV